MKKIISLIMLFLFLLGLPGCKDTLVYETDSKTLGLISDVEVILTKMRFAPGKEIEEEFKKKIRELEEKAENDKHLEAKVNGLYGEFELLKGNHKKALKYMDQVERKNSNDEYFFFLKAHLDEDQSMHQPTILKGIKKANPNNRLKLHLATLYLETGNYNLAVDLFDEVFTKLKDEQVFYYKSMRDLAYKFIDDHPRKKETVKILLNNEITVSEMIEITRNESKILKEILDEEIYKAEITELFKYLLENKYFYTTYNKIEEDTLIKRKDVAYFLLFAISIIENDSSLLSRYKIDYEYSRNTADNKSSMEDVKFSDYYYNAAMILIEREIMELPDGSNFFPKKTISGLEFYELIKNLDSWY